MLPVVCVVGKSGVGKTLLIEGLLPILTKKGYRVAVVKHTPHGYDLSPQGKDSERMARAGAAAVVMSGPGGMGVFLPTDGDRLLEEVVRWVEATGDYDLLMAEGYKESSFPKVEVHRPDLGPDLLSAPEGLIAVVSEMPPSITVPTFRPDEAEGLARFLEEEVLRPGEQREEVRLEVNGREVPLDTSFARAVVLRTLLGMASALRGVPEGVRSLRLTVWRRATLAHRDAP